MNDIEKNPSFSGDIRLYSHSGLCNRLRLIAEYKHLSDITNKNIEMFWVKSTQCNCLFENIFKPIPKINFNYLKMRRSKSLRPENTAQKLGLFPHDEEIRQKNHLIFNPVDSIANTIKQTIQRIDGDYVACHIRRTDIGTIQKKYKKQPPTDEYFDSFIESYPNHKIYIATDSKKTQERFIKKFGDRVYYSNVPSGEGHSRQPYRTTPIEEAVVDLFLCIHSFKFCGTVCSSFSEFIKNYKKGKACQLNQ